VVLAILIFLGLPGDSMPIKELLIFPAKRFVPMVFVLICYVFHDVW